MADQELQERNKTAVLDALASINARLSDLQDRVAALETTTQGHDNLLQQHRVHQQMNTVKILPLDQLLESTRADLKTCREAVLILRDEVRGGPPAKTTRAARTPA